MTQTAVEWLIEQINSENYQNAFGPVYISSILIEPALEMEKQQIMDAHLYGQFYKSPQDEDTSEQYYNEQFEK